LTHVLVDSSAQGVNPELLQDVTHDLVDDTSAYVPIVLQTKTHAFIPSSAKYGFTHKA
jgi:hypothetical protein